MRHLKFKILEILGIIILSTLIYSITKFWFPQFSGNQNLSVGKSITIEEKQKEGGGF